MIVQLVYQKKRIESNQCQEDTQVENESQSSTFQNANQYSSATTSAESYDLAPGGEEATTPTTTEPSRAKEKQSAQPATAQQFRHPPPFLKGSRDSNKTISSAKSWKY